jgi:hypothetical protein
MCPQDSPSQQAGTFQLNTELQEAHMELLSAHCATHQLRLRYSSEELVRLGKRDVLRKSALAASELHDFYSSIEQKLPRPPAAAAPPPSIELIAQAVDWMACFLWEQRELYAPRAVLLPPRFKADLRCYFSSDLLDQIRVVELHGACVSVPAFFAQARALGFDPPEIAHMDSLTFLDVVAFNQQLSMRALFHALVHAVQIRTLGLTRYAELWVHSFIRTRAHFTVPLEVHAFSLASKFLRPSKEPFSVEEQVSRWLNDGRY